jgi:hypothetical protein
MEFGASNRLHIFQRCDSNEARSIGVARLHLKPSKKKESLEKALLWKIDFEGESEALSMKISNDLCSRVKADLLTVELIFIMIKLLQICCNFLLSDRRNLLRNPIITDANHHCSRTWT